MPTYDDNGALLITGAGILADHEHSAVGDGGTLTIGTTVFSGATQGRILFSGVGLVVDDDADLFWDDTTKRLGLGTATPARRVHAADDDVATNTIIPIFRLESQVDAGVGAAGHGPGLELFGESSTTLNTEMGIIAARWSVATHASRRARLEFRADYIATDVLCGVIEAPATASADGNARGIGAVDLQGYRGAAVEVASGNYSVIGGGRENVANNTYATVSGGDDNEATAQAATIGGGQNNIASNSSATVGGGFTNTASGAIATVAGGNTNTASGLNSAIGGGDENLASDDYSVVPGGLRAVADKYGQLAHAAGRFAANGDAQRSAFIARIDRATHVLNNWYSLYLDGAAEQMVIAASSAWTFRALVVGLTANAAQQWSYEVVGVIERDNAGNTTLAASTTTTIFESDANYDAQAVADDANEALEIQVRRTGGADFSVQWVATIYTAECIHT